MSCWDPPASAQCRPVWTFTAAANLLSPAAGCKRGPREFYRRTLEYLQDNTITDNHHVGKAFTLGDVFTVYWPLIFGEPAVLNNTTSDCDLFSSSLGCETA